LPENGGEQCESKQGFHESSHGIPLLALNLIARAFPAACLQQEDI
jgi:hypothetical protein